tara:strand:- start:370 stop:780 length:411 start_codon:yes stop_codon:yes gene_type:complete
MANITDKRICEECNFQLPIEKFPKITGDRRRHTCHRCTRGRKEAAKHGMTVEEYLSFSSGPCVFCGDPETKAFFFDGFAQPVARICGRHRMMFRAFRNFEELALCYQILAKFPFWIDLLRKNNLCLFSGDSISPFD